MNLFLVKSNYATENDRGRLPSVPVVVKGHTEQKASLYGTITDHMRSASHGSRAELQMTPDGFTFIADDERHLFNCTAGQTATPAAFSRGCCVGSVVSVVSLGLNVPAPLTPLLHTVLSLISH